MLTAMNAEKLKQLKLKASAQIGGKGTPRRKGKVVHRSGHVDDKKLQATLKKVGLQNIGPFEEVTMLFEEGKVLQFSNPNLQYSQSGSTFAIQGTPAEKSLMDVLPNIINHLGPDALKELVSKFSSQAGAAPSGASADDDEAPELVQSFEETAKTE